MQDQSKRTTLKTLAAAAAVVAVPAVAQTAIQSNTSGSNVAVVVAHMQSQLAMHGVTLDVMPMPEHASLRVQFTNSSDTSVRLDHVSPCLIRSNGRAYDINTALKDHSRQIAASDSCAFIVEAI